MPVEPIYRGQTIACIATGPSLTPQQVESARTKGFVLFGCNNVALDVPDLSVLYGCNEGWWDHYWPQISTHRASKWTTNRAAAAKYGLNWIAERNERGLSTDPAVIHHGHGSGYSMLNIAYLMGAARIVLLGFDLKYAPDYNGAECHIGSAPRHYFGEYPSALQHWPKVHVRGGIHTELIGLYESVARQAVVEIVNCSADSALECFPRIPIDAL